MNFDEKALVIAMYMDQLFCVAIPYQLTTFSICSGLILLLVNHYSQCDQYSVRI